MSSFLKHSVVRLLSTCVVFAAGVFVALSTLAWLDDRDLNGAATTMRLQLAHKKRQYDGLSSSSAEASSASYYYRSAVKYAESLVHPALIGSFSGPRRVLLVTDRGNNKKNDDKDLVLDQILKWECVRNVTVLTLGCESSTRNGEESPAEGKVHYLPSVLPYKPAYARKERYYRERVGLDEDDKEDHYDSGYEKDDDARHYVTVTRYTTNSTDLAAWLGAHGMLDKDIKEGRKYGAVVLDIDAITNTATTTTTNDVVRQQFRALAEATTETGVVAYHVGHAPVLDDDDIDETAPLYFTSLRHIMSLSLVYYHTRVYEVALKKDSGGRSSVLASFCVGLVPKVKPEDLPPDGTMTDDEMSDRAYSILPLLRGVADFDSRSARVNLKLARGLRQPYRGGPAPLRFYDGHAHQTMRAFTADWEAVFCHEAFTFGHQQDEVPIRRGACAVPAKLATCLDDFESFSELKLGEDGVETSSGVYATKNIPKGTYTGLADAAYTYTFSTSDFYDLYELNGDDGELLLRASPFSQLMHWISRYGYVGGDHREILVTGGKEYGAFYNHACDGKDVSIGWPLKVLFSRQGPWNPILAKYKLEVDTIMEIAHDMVPGEMFLDDYTSWDQSFFSVSKDTLDLWCGNNSSTTSY